MNRIASVIRMQLINRYTYIWVPALILGGAFLISLGIFALIPVDTPKYGGGAQAPLWYFAVVGVQSLTLTFPFSQAMSVTRREFYLGTLATAALSALGMAIVFVLGGLLEQATNGFGVNGYFFTLPWVWAAGPLAAGLTYFAISMLFFVVGFWAATIFKRFGSMILTITLLAVAVVLLGLAALISLTGSWPAVWEGIIALGSLGLTLGGIVLIAVLAASSFVTLRRAIP